MSEVIRVRGKYYILAGSALADDRARVLKHGDTFAVFDRHGDIQPVGLMNQGLYHEGTRFLSRLELRLGGERPLLLGSTVQEDVRYGLRRAKEELNRTVDETTGRPTRRGKR